MEVTWIGHATVRLELDGVTFLTDPVLGSLAGLRRRSATPRPDAADGVHVVLLSHGHHDHLDLASLRSLPPGARVFVPRGGAALLASAGLATVTEVMVGDRVAVGSVQVSVTPAVHSGLRLPRGPYIVPVGYMIEGSQRVYFAGDTALFPGMAQIGRTGIDLALLPVGGWGPRLRGGHLDPRTAAEALTLIRPRIAIPIHWGTFWPTGMDRVAGARFGEPGGLFVGRAHELSPETRIVVAGASEVIDLPSI